MKTAAAVFLGRRREALSSTTRNQSSSMLQMGSSRNRDPLKLSRDEDPSWDLEDPPKPRRKPSRTYSVLFISKTFKTHHLAVTSLNLN